MKAYYKKRYCISEQGADNLVKATWSCFWTYCINIAPMVLMMALLNHLVMNEENGPLAYLVMAAGVLASMHALLSNEYVRLYNATYKESANLRVSLAENLADLPLAYFSKHDLSDLSQTIMSDVERIEHAMSHSIPKVMALWMFLPVMGGLMLLGSWKLALAVMLPALLSFLFIPLAKRRQVSGYRRHFQALRDNSDMFQQTIDLQQEISSFDLSEQVKRSLYRSMENGEKLHLKAELNSMIAMGASSVFAFVSVAAVIAVGIRLLTAGEVSVLMLLGYMICAMKIKELFDISKEGIMEMFYIDPAVKRIKEIRQTPVQQGEDEAPQDYDVVFEHVSFSYDADTPVLKDVSFTAPQGRVTALVGPSGSGKTSVLRLMSRLYDHDGGRILIGGKDIKTLSVDALFQKVSVVFQDVTLFNTSVLENIRLGDPKADDEAVRRAAQLANCMDFIDKLPLGFDTVIGENGAELSGGERQRLSIARAFLKDAPILILDEISANLDVDHEQKIQESLNRLIRDKTVIIISHRMKSVEKVDQIVVVDDGRVESAGRHEDLLRRSPVYRNLIEKTALAEAFRF